MANLNGGGKKKFHLNLLRVIGLAAQQEITNICHTDDHSVRVAIMSAAIASELGRPHEEAVRVGISGFYHDVGKMHPEVEKYVKSSSRLTEAQRQLIRQIHTSEGGKLVFAQLPSSYDRDTVWHISAGAFFHHLRYAGEVISEDARVLLFPEKKGPLMLAERGIPLAARIVAVADVYDAIAGGKRVYQPKQYTERKRLPN